MEGKIDKKYGIGRRLLEKAGGSNLTGKGMGKNETGMLNPVQLVGVQKGGVGSS